MVLLKTRTGVIPANQNEIVFTDDTINSDSIIEVYYDTNEVYTVEQWQNGTSVHIISSDHEHNVGVKILINNINSFSPYDDTSIREEVSVINDSLGDTIDDVRTLENDYMALDGVVNNIGTMATTHQDQLTANNTPIYLDYQGGKYGYNTSSTRGADTFTPFSEEATYNELVGRLIVYTSTTRTYTASRDGILDITDVWNGRNNRPTIKVNGVTKTISWIVYANLSNTTFCIQGTVPDIHQGDTIEITTQTDVNFDVVVLFIK